MEFRLSSEQKENLAALGCLEAERFEELVELLEHHLSEAYVKVPDSYTSPLLEAREKLGRIRKDAEKLSRELSMLTPNDQYRIGDIVSIDYHEVHDENGQTSWRRVLDVQQIVSLLGKAAGRIIDESMQEFGSRSNDKAIHWLFDFWEEYVGSPVGPLYERGEFVQFVAIILEKDPEAAGKQVARFFKQRT